MAPALPTRKVCRNGGRAAGLGFFTSLHQLPQGLDLLWRVHVAALGAAIPMIEVHGDALRSGRAPLRERIRRIDITTRGERAGPSGRGQSKPTGTARASPPWVCYAGWVGDTQNPTSRGTRWPRR